MIGSSDRRLSSLSGPNANRFLDRHNKNPAVIQSSCSGLTYNGLNRAPNTIIRDDDFKFKLRQKVAEVFATRRDGRVICPPTQHLYFADGYTFHSPRPSSFHTDVEAFSKRKQPGQSDCPAVSSSFSRFTENLGVNYLFWGVRSG
jgi:hypothetical protein